MATVHTEQVIRINKLKTLRNAVILGHYYTNPEVQNICDYVGDSLGLSQQAATTNADIIVFCGVHFMAETASILAQDKKVLLPNALAGCSLAESIEPINIAKWRKQHPNGVVISYVNTTAEIKALTDCCCTSANALRVVESYREAERILFLPDWNLGNYVQLVTGIEMDVWPGICCVHDTYTPAIVLRALADFPNARLLMHPECSAATNPLIVNNSRVTIASTSGMIAALNDDSTPLFIVATEPGVMHQMRIKAPNKGLIPLVPESYCKHMKLTTLDQVEECLEKQTGEVRVEATLATKAITSIRRMLEV